MSSHGEFGGYQFEIWFSLCSEMVEKVEEVDETKDSSNERGL